MTPTAPGWILEPVSRATLFVGEEARIGALIERALVHVEGAETLLNVAMPILLRAGKRESVSAMQRLLRDAPTQERWARELRESGYLVLNAHATIATWSAVETCLEDTVVGLLLNAKDVLADVAARGVRIDLRGAALEEEEARTVAVRLQRKCEVKGDIVATYEAMLGVFGLTAKVPDATASVLRELNAVRNCLLHRGGAIDDRAIHQAPALSKWHHRPIQVRKDDFLRYFDAVSAWLVALMNSVCASRYMPA